MYINQTTYSNDKMKQLSAFSLKTKLIPYLVIVESIFFIVAIIAYFFSLFVFLVTVVVIILMPFALIFSHKLKQKHILKNSPSLKRQPRLKYIFDEELILIEYLDESDHISKIRYSDIYLGSEDLFNFYLYPNPVSAFIIDKKGFESEDIAEIKRFLKTRLNKTKFNKKLY